jgi:hypothetical protein
MNHSETLAFHSWHLFRLIIADYSYLSIWIFLSLFVFCQLLLFRIVVFIILDPVLADCRFLSLFFYSVSPALCLSVPLALYLSPFSLPVSLPFRSLSLSLFAPCLSPFSLPVSLLFRLLSVSLTRPLVSPSPLSGDDAV